MDKGIDPAELLKEWMHEYELRIRELQCVSAYLHARLEDLETPSSLNSSSHSSPGAPFSSPFLTVDEVARMLSITPMGIRTRLKKREFPTGIVVKVGRRAIRFDREKLLLWIRGMNTKYQAKDALKR